VFGRGERERLIKGGDTIGERQYKWLSRNQRIGGEPIIIVGLRIEQIRKEGTE
jgi:hypothetical protein